MQDREVSSETRRQLINIVAMREQSHRTALDLVALLPLPRDALEALLIEFSVASTNGGPEENDNIGAIEAPLHRCDTEDEHSTEGSQSSSRQLSPSESHPDQCRTPRGYQELKAEEVSKLRRVREKCEELTAKLNAKFHRKEEWA